MFKDFGSHRPDTAVVQQELQTAGVEVVMETPPFGGVEVVGVLRDHGKIVLTFQRRSDHYHIEGFIPQEVVDALDTHPAGRGFTHLEHDLALVFDQAALNLFVARMQYAIEPVPAGLVMHWEG
ncbi:MAG: hypothetical protein U0641_13915 [Anaerolineae bacterium]